MKRLAVTVVIVVALFWGGVCTGWAQFMTGSELLSRLRLGENLSDADTYDAFSAMGYILGVYDATNGVYFDAPTGVTVGQMKDIVIRYLIEHSEKGWKFAGLMVIQAYAEAYPLKD